MPTKGLPYVPLRQIPRDPAGGRQGPPTPDWPDAETDAYYGAPPGSAAQARAQGLWGQPLARQGPPTPDWPDHEIEAYYGAPAGSAAIARQQGWGGAPTPDMPDEQIEAYYGAPAGSAAQARQQGWGAAPTGRTGKPTVRWTDAEIDAYYGAPAGSAAQARAQGWTGYGEDQKQPARTGAPTADWSDEEIEAYYGAPPGSAAQARAQGWTGFGEDQKQPAPPAPTPPTGTPLDPGIAALEAEMRAQALANRTRTLAEIEYQKARTKYEYGFDDTSNPYNQAAMLQRSYEQGQKGHVNQMAARGQLYAGVTQAGQDAGTYRYNRGQHDLRQSYADQLNAFTGRGAQAEADYQAALTAAKGAALDRTLGMRPLDPGVPPPPGGGVPPPAGRPPVQPVPPPVLPRVQPNAPPAVPAKRPAKLPAEVWTKVPNPVNQWVPAHQIVQKGQPYVPLQQVARDPGLAKQVQRQLNQGKVPSFTPPTKRRK